MKKGGTRMFGTVTGDGVIRTQGQLEGDVSRRLPSCACSIC